MRDLQLVLDEYTFMHRWVKHSEAVSAGFRPGDRVYGQILKGGGKFDARKTAAWRRAYEKSERAEFLGELRSQVDIGNLEPQVVEWSLRVCLAVGIWSRVRLIDNCRFEFTAGVESADVSGLGVRPVKFEVHGARCAAWPRRRLSARGHDVRCQRSGDGAVTVELRSDRAGLTRQSLPPLAHTDMLPEPLQEEKRSEPVPEVISLSRSRDYRLRQLGKGCPTCGLYSADVRPSDPDAVILRAVTVSSSGGGWRPCPAGLRCGVYEFSPPDTPLVSGCTGVSVCRVWRLAETSAEASDVVQLTTQKSELACVNCPSGIDFPTAHARWQEARERKLPRCEVVPDSPAQSFGATPRK